MDTVANTVSISTNLNVSPYYDDFDETKNFHRILFRPGLAVQARELTQMQSIIQNQIDRFAENIFKEGSIVRGCQATYEQDIEYIKLRDNSSTGQSVNAAAFLGKTITGSTNKIQATVIDTSVGAEANTPDFKTLFVKYISSNTNGTKFIANGEVITASGGLTANLISASAGGTGSRITLQSGIIFAKDHFINVPKQTLILDKYSSNVSYKVGYTITESIITETNDSSLLDPASGAYNYAAPGAARFKIVATLAKTALTTASSNNFVQLIEIKNGFILKNDSGKSQYNILKDYIAERTNDESGDYIVRGLSTRLREHLDAANNQGVYVSGLGGNSSLLVLDIEPGKAYVKGYDIETISTSHVEMSKATDINRVNAGTILADYGNFVYVYNVVGKWDVNAQGLVSLRNAWSNTIPSANYSITNLPGSPIGTARVRAINHYTGTPGTAAAVYKLYLSDIKMNANGAFTAVKSICFNAGGLGANSSLPTGKADISGANGLNANTTDPSFDYAVYRIPAKAVKTIRDTSSAVDTNFEFYRSFDVSVGATSQFTVDTGLASETFSGSGVLSDAVTRTNFYLVSRGSSNTSNLTGTVTITSGSAAVTGSGTSFTTQVNPGDIIATTATNKFSVKQVTNNTALVLETTAGSSTNGAFHKRFQAGQVIDMGGTGRSADRSININSTTTALFNIGEGTLGAGGSFNATVICKLNKTAGQEAAKTVNRSRLVELRCGTGGGYVGNTSGPWPLGLSDGFKLVSVRQKSGTRFTTLTEGTDVTSHFTLNTGMLDNMYDHASLVKKSTSGLSIAANDRFLVALDHFTHSTASGVGYFSVDSYPVNDSTAGTDTTKIFTYQIPVFVSPVDGLKYDLRDSIDTRPRITDTANSVTSITNISTNPARSTAFVEPSGGLHFPVVASSFTADYDYYLKRKDAIVLAKEGLFSVVKGTSSLFPVTPPLPEGVMHMATVSVAPYPSLTQETARRNSRQDLSCTVLPIKNERFTMKNIAAIRDRVDNIEYYTALNLLEKDAKDLLIADSSGRDRFKNGILVDSFTGHNVGNVHDSDYKIAIDNKMGEARPPFKMDNIEMFYNSANSSNIVRTNVTTAGVSKDQTIYISNSQVIFANSATITSGSSTATLRFQVDNKLYIEDATGNFVVSATVTTASPSRSATIIAVDTTTAGDLITLPYSHEIISQQKYSTTTRNLAGLFYSFIGQMSLTPDNDYWVDTVNRPDVTINFDLNTDAWLYVANSWGTDWGNWKKTITGYTDLGNTERNLGESRAVAEDGGTDIIQSYVTENTTLISESNTRDGIRSIMTPTTTTQTIGGLVKDVNIQPFMRSRVVRIYASGMKNNTKLYSFFDGTNVSAYITPTNSAYANTGNEGSSLKSDSSGNVYGEFRIPNDPSLRFRTGNKKFRITDNPTNASGIGLTVTSAETTYTAEGLTTGIQTTHVSTRQPQLSQTTVSEQFGSSSTSTQVVGSGTRLTGHESPPPSPPPVTPAQPIITGDGDDGRGGGSSGDDPIGQSFFVDSYRSSKVISTGMFVTKVDLFFATKDPIYPVTVELRLLNAGGGFSGDIPPFARVTLQASEINVSSDGSKPTPFYFPSPVYLLDKKEYGFKIIPGGLNPNTTTWTARIGENDILTGARVSSQPAVGMLFASGNDKTFSAVQEEDIKYTLYQASFDTTSTGTVVFKNEDRDYMSIANVSAGFTRAGELVHGETILRGTFANTKTLSVANNTTFAQGFVSGATGIVSSFAAGQVRVKRVSTSVKFKGGERIRIRTNNSTTGGIVGNSTGAIVSTVTPTGRVAYYDAITASNTFLHLSNTSYINSGPVPVTAGGFSNNRMFTPGTFVSGQADGYFARIISLNNLKVDVMQFTKDYLRPSNTTVTFTGAFAKSTSTKDTSFIAINTNDSTEFPASRFVLSRSVESNTSASSSGMNAARSFEVKGVITSTNRLASPVLDVRRVSTTTIENLINSNTAIGSSEDYVKFGGDAKTRYITRKVTLADGQDAEDILVYLSAYKPATADIYVYYKILNREDSDTFLDARWIPMTQNTASTIISDAENTGDFKEFIYNVPNYPLNPAKITRSSVVVNLSGANNTTGVIEYRNSAGGRFSGYKYLAIKIVMVNSVSVKPPRITDLRVICLQK